MIVLNTPTIKNHNYEEITIITATSVTIRGTVFSNIIPCIDNAKNKAINEMIKMAQEKNADAIINTVIEISSIENYGVITATGTAVKILD